MTVHVHPASSHRAAATHRPSPRLSTGHWVLVGGLFTILGGLVATWVLVVPPLLADWASLTPFETSIAWLVSVVLSALLVAAGCLSAAAALWRPTDAASSDART